MAFVLISLIVFAPMFFKGYSSLKSKVHDMQSVLAMSSADISVSDDYFKKCAEDTMPVNKQALSAGYKVAEIECDNAAIGCNVYYGINRVSKRSGAAMSSDSAMFGDGGCVIIDGDASTYFKALENVEKGDVFTVTTPNEVYTYTVKQIMTAEKYDKKKGDCLVLSTDGSHKAFAHQNAEKLYVVAMLDCEEAE